MSFRQQEARQEFQEGKNPYGFVLFDFDGTIADTFQISLNVMEVLAERFNFGPVDSKTQQDIRENGLRAFLKKKKIRLWQLPRLVLAAKALMKNHIDESWLFPRMRETLEELRNQGFLLGLATSNSQENIELFIRKENLDGFFTKTYCDLALFGKAKCLKEINSVHKILLYVGDESRDIEAANKARVPSIAVSWGFESSSNLATARPTALIHSPSELVDTVRRLLHTS